MRPTRPMVVVTRLLVSIGVLALLTALSAGVASAHTELEDSDPEDGATLKTAPDQIRLTFAAAPFDTGLGVVLLDPDGDNTSLNARVEGVDVIAPWPQARSGGGYQVNWRVVAADGHPLSGSLRFSIHPASSTSREPDPKTPATPEVTAPSAVSDSAGSQSSFPTWVLILIGVLVLIGVGVAIRRVRGMPDT